MAWTEPRPGGKWRGGYRDHDGRQRRRTFDTQVDAMLWARAKEGLPTSVEAIIARKEAEIADLQDQIRRLRNGTDSFLSLEATEIASVPTMGEFIERWLPEKLKTLAPNSHDSYKSACKKIVLVFADWPVNRIFKSDVQSWYNQLPGKPRTKGTTLKIFKSICYVIMNESRNHPGSNWMTANPCVDIDEETAAHVDRHALKPLEEKQLLARASQDQLVHDMAIVGIDSGLRRGEALGLTIPAIDLGNKTLSVYAQMNPQGQLVKITKDRRANGTSLKRTLPLTARQVAMFTRRIADAEALGTEVLFTIDGRNIKSDHWNARWDAVRNDLPRQYDFHELRYTFLTRMFQRGVPADQIREMAGHSTLEITAGYRDIKWSETDQETARNAIESWTEDE